MISVREASLLLGGSEQWTRSLCVRNKIGDAFSGGGHRYTYHIVPGQLAEYMRISEDELERRLKGVRNGK
nr:MAG TPA: hypothetical protein [Bacteriophage sp.]